MLRLAGILRGGRDDLDDRVAGLLDRSRALEKELDQIKSALASSAGQDLASQAVDVAGVKVLAARIDGVDPKSLRDTLDQIKDKLGSAVVVLATEVGRQGQPGGRRHQGPHRPAQGRRPDPRGGGPGRRQGRRAPGHGPGRRHRPGGSAGGLGWSRAGCAARTRLK